jgi:hypothetical protein
LANKRNGKEMREKGRKRIKRERSEETVLTLRRRRECGEE